jgi:hypothetical protein
MGDRGHSISAEWARCHECLVKTFGLKAAPKSHDSQCRARPFDEGCWPRVRITRLLLRRHAGAVALWRCRNRHRSPRGETMKVRTSAAAAAALGLVTASVLVLQVRAGADKIAFPESYDKGVMYFSFDKPDAKQFREIYVTPAAVAALNKGEAVPPGTVITQVLYKAKLDADGNPVKDANGHFIKTDIAAYAVMETPAGAPNTRPRSATANGSIRSSRRKRRSTRRPISPPASSATSRWRAPISCSRRTR